MLFKHVIQFNPGTLQGGGGSGFGLYCKYIYVLLFYAYNIYLLHILYSI